MEIESLRKWLYLISLITERGKVSLILNGISISWRPQQTSSFGLSLITTLGLFLVLKVSDLIRFDPEISVLVRKRGTLMNLKNLSGRFKKNISYDVSSDEDLS